jgi:hypothetical protein
MVNMFTGEQLFIGLHNPPGKPPVGRTMALDHGYCPDLMRREPGKALTLPNVNASALFYSNPVVDKIGIQTYAGAHVLDRPTGIVLGTVCIVGKVPLPLSVGAPIQALLKQRAGQLMDLIENRTVHRQDTSPHANQP